MKQVLERVLLNKDAQVSEKGRLLETHKPIEKIHRKNFEPLFVLCL